MFEQEPTQARNAKPATPIRFVSTQPSSVSHWDGLAHAEDEAKFCSAWLSMQCTRIPGVAAGLLMMPPPAKGLSVASTSWPERNPFLQEMMRLAERASVEGRAGVSPGRTASHGPSSGLMIALPLGCGIEAVAVVAVALAKGFADMA